MTQPQKLEHVNLIEDSRLVNKPVVIDAIISSTSDAYQIPKEYTVTIADDEGNIVDEKKDLKIPIQSSLNLELINSNNEYIHKRLKSFSCLKNVKNLKISSWRTAYSLRIRPPVFNLEKIDNKIVDEKGYEYKAYEIFIISEKPLNFKASTLVRFTGLPFPHPRTQKITFLVYDVELIDDDLNYDTEKMKLLRAKFEGKSVLERLNWILDNFENYSHIIDRCNIATAGLLCYYSQLYYTFDNDRRNGWAIISPIGDTTTGKSEVIKKLGRLLKMGLILSAETASSVGLTGTAYQRERSTWAIEWGYLPLQDRKLLALDGCQMLNPEAWAKQAEAERSGIITISKAAKDQTNARTRQIKIFNPLDIEQGRYGTKSLSSFLYPCLALPTVLDPTSIARQDLVVFSDTRDVDIKEISKKMTKKPEEELYFLAETLKWAWTGKIKVEWIDKAVDFLLEKSIELKNKFFCEEVPLVSNDIKYKLAKLSISFAFLTLSSNEDFTTVTVTEEHVQTIVDFINDEYMKAGLHKLVQENAIEKLSFNDAIHEYKIIQNIFDDERLPKILRSISESSTPIRADGLKTEYSLTVNREYRPLINVLTSERYIKSTGKGFLPTKKLFEIYRLTEGFTKLEVNLMEVSS
jgi:hypothetical protein